MNEKVQQIVQKVDFITDKCDVIVGSADRSVELLKKPFLACIPALINKITSKFSVATIALFGAFYFIFCLKNMLVSFFFEDGPSGMAFSYAFGSIIITALGCYVVYKTMGIFDKIIASSECRISSLNIFEIMVVVYLTLSVGSLLGGIYLAIDAKYFNFVIYGIIGSVFFFLLALYNSAPEDFAIVQDEKASAGEDFTAISTFVVKVILRLVPIAVFVVPIIGIFECIPEIFTTYTVSEGKEIYLNNFSMIMEMESLRMFLLVGCIPLFAYIYYLISYVSLDLIRAVLSLPQKLDELKK